MNDYQYTYTELEMIPESSDQDKLDQIEKKVLLIKEILNDYLKSEPKKTK